MRRRWLMIGCGVAVLAAGCGSSSSGAVGPVSTGQQLLRGSVIASYSCSVQAAGQQVSLAAGDVTAIRLCPLQTVNGPRRTINLGSSKPRLERLTAALAAPDGHSSPGTSCPEFADVTQTVIARTPTGPVLLHIPVDGCGHYLSAALSLLTTIRGGNAPAASQ